MMPKRQSHNRFAFFICAAFIVFILLIQGCGSFLSKGKNDFVRYIVNPKLLKKENEIEGQRSFLEVEIFFPKSSLPRIPSQANYRLLFPNWAPGSYQYIVFAKSVKNLQAFDANGNEIEMQEEDNGIWSIRAAPHRVKYQVNRFSNAGMMWAEETEITERNIFFNSTNVFATLEGCRFLPCSIEIKVPKGWRAISPILSESGKGYATDYDELLDSPVYLGNPLFFTIPVLNKQFHFGIDLYDVSKDSIGFRADSLLVLTKEVIQAHHKFFRELPFTAYNFFIRLSKPKLFTSYGALEHRASSVYEMPIYPPEKTRDNALLQVISHEFFHLWNPKRIYPESLAMPNLQERYQSKNMWFIEGVTDYFSELLMMKQGIQTEESFLLSMLERIKRYRRNIKTDSLSLEQMSLRLAQSNSNADFFPFYERGTITAMMLDLEIRKQSRGKQSLETALQELYQSYGKSQKPYPEEQLIEVLESLTQTKLKDFAKRFISSVEELPFEDLFRSAGYKFINEKREVPNLGFLTEQRGTGHHTVSFVVPDSPAEKTGLMADDEIIEANGERAYDKIHQTFFKEGVLKKGDVLTLIVNRKEKRLTLHINVKTGTIRNERIAIDSSATQEAKRIRESLIRWSD